MVRDNESSISDQIGVSSPSLIYSYTHDPPLLVTPVKSDIDSVLV